MNIRKWFCHHEWVDLRLGRRVPKYRKITHEMFYIPQHLMVCCKCNTIEWMPDEQYKVEKALQLWQKSRQKESL